MEGELLYQEITQDVRPAIFAADRDMDNPFLLVGGDGIVWKYRIKPALEPAPVDGDGGGEDGGGDVIL